MTGSPLDRPVWAALRGLQATMAVDGGPHAVRYRPEISPLSAIAASSAEAWAALSDLVPAGDHVYVMEPLNGSDTPGLVVEKTAGLSQLVLARLGEAPPVVAPIVPLGDADIAEMIALAKLTQPGPFEARTIDFGGYIGVKVDGRLAAMAGERMRLPGYGEVSAVCTHPDMTGRGFAAMLSHAVTRRIVARGEVPFLHAYTTNAAALLLYRRLGFALRAELQVTLLRGG